MAEHENTPEPESPPVSAPAPEAPDSMPEQTPSPEPEPAGASAADAETSSISEPQFLHPDSSAAVSGSQRLRLIPPDGKPASWVNRHKEKIIFAEMALTGLFFLLALYFLFKWITYEPEISYAPSRDGFLAALMALPPVRAKSTWKADSAPGRWRGIVVHHTAGTRGTVASIDRYHREENKWPNGLGYHFLIGNGNGMDDGEIAPGPRWQKQLDGAHVRMKGTSKGNSFSIGVALVGNFEEAVPSSKQLASLRGLLQFLTAEYDIKPGDIVGHGQVSEKYTACPGKLFFIDEVVKTLR